MKKIILVLGAPNDARGNLSQIALDRLTCVLVLYQANPDFEILCTGGFGDHFNTTSKPHSFYAKLFLMNKGIPAEVISESALSSNTIADFKFTKDRILGQLPELLVIVTSDFHMERAKLLYNKIINYPKVLFVPAKSTLSALELISLQQYEKLAIERLKV